MFVFGFGVRLLTPTGEVVPIRGGRGAHGVFDRIDRAGCFGG